MGRPPLPSGPPYRIQSECGLSEEVRVCRPKCEPTCGDRNPTCSATCGEAVCMCQRGSVRQSGMCVPISACRFFDFEVETKTSVNKKGRFVFQLPTKPPSVRAPLAKAVSPKAVTSETATVLHRPPTLDLSRRRGPIGPIGPTTNRAPPKNVRVPIPPSRSPNRSPPSIVPNRPLNRSPSPTLPKKTPSSMNAGPVPPTTLPPKPRLPIMFISYGEDI
nr:Protease inhibitor I8 domain containing protein [Haemonchus contortus]